jgi:hypothetical protein
MSLGAPFGSNADADVVATDNAAKAGVIVVAAAGNEGPNTYLVGSPSVAAGAISVAATDSTQTFPGATITLPAATVTAIDANGVTLAPSATYTVKVITDNSATPENEAIGCSIDAFGGANKLPPNTIAVVKRGVCARVAKAIFGQQAGAAAVVMVNTSPGLPPFEGPITSNPDDGVPFNVTIPFFGVLASAGAQFAAADGASAVVTPAQIANPTFAQLASFSSAGPRSADSALKPDITAPGVSIFSTANGTGNGGLTLSGTSMASPHVTGVAALMREAHPSWTTQEVKSAIVNTGDPSRVVGYAISLAGTGLVQPVSSTKSQVVASADDDAAAVSVNYGFAELASDFTQKKSITLFNKGATPAKFIVTTSNAQGDAHSVDVDRSSVTVPAGGKASVKVTLNVPVAGVAPSSSPDLNEAAGLVQFTPATQADNGGIALRVPYYFVPRALSNVSTTIGNFAGTNPAAVATVTNAKHAPLAGDADFYAWGLGPKHDDRYAQQLPANAADIIRAVGVQSFPGRTADDTVMVFAVNTYNRVSNAAANEYDIYVDVDGDGVDDYAVVAADYGAVTAGDSNGVVGSFVFSLRSGAGSIFSFAVAPTDSSVTLLPVAASQLCGPGEPCLDATTNPRITYHSVGFDRNGGVDIGLDTAKFNVWNSAISTGGFAAGVKPGATDATNVVSVNSAEWAKTPAKGLMIVTFDNASGAGEAQLVPVNVKK